MKKNKSVDSGGGGGGAFALESTPLKMRGAFSVTSIFLFNPLQDSSISSLTRLLKYTIVMLQFIFVTRVIWTSVVIYTVLV